MTNHVPNGLLMAVLPGPDRKRTPGVYCYRVTYKNPHIAESGCAMTWAVIGGRGAYQIALERVGPTALKWHCTCADAVYRGDRNERHVCKHVAGLLETMPLAV